MLSHRHAKRLCGTACADDIAAAGPLLAERHARMGVGQWAVTAMLLTMLQKAASLYRRTRYRQCACHGIAASTQCGPCIRASVHRICWLDMPRTCLLAHARRQAAVIWRLCTEPASGVRAARLRASTCSRQVLDRLQSIMRTMRLWTRRRAPVDAPSPGGSATPVRGSRPAPRPPTL
jgi:hypothetical protein